MAMEQIWGATGSGIYADKDGKPQQIGGLWMDKSRMSGGNEGGDGNDPFGWIAARAAEGKRNVEEGVGQAAVDVMSAYEKARQAKERNLGARGVNPSSGIYQGAQNEWALARAAAEAGARNRARFEGEKENQGLMDRLLSMKISQYNSNRSYASANASPTITVGGRNPTRDARNARNAASAEAEGFYGGLNYGNGGAVNGSGRSGGYKAPVNGQVDEGSGMTYNSRTGVWDPAGGANNKVYSGHVYGTGSYDAKYTKTGSQSEDPFANI